MIAKSEDMNSPKSMPKPLEEGWIGTLSINDRGTYGEYTLAINKKIDLHLVYEDRPEKDRTLKLSLLERTLESDRTSRQVALFEFLPDSVARNDKLYEEGDLPSSYMNYLAIGACARINDSIIKQGIIELLSEIAHTKNIKFAPPKK